jgi:signal transduction histidine kinase
MIRVRQVAARHPLRVDAGLAALLALAGAPVAAAGVPGAVGWLWFGAVHAPLVWRRRSPVPVFWAVLALAVAGWTVAGIDAGYPFAPLLVALATLARHRSWRRWLPAVAALAAVLASGWHQDGLGLDDVATLAAVLAAAVLAGITLRTRQAYLTQLRRRAAAAERTRIAREVHDIVSHNLAVMVALADGAALTATAAPQRAAATLTTIAVTGREALDEMHRLLGLLRDAADGPTTAPQPGLDDLDDLLAQVRAAGLPVTLAREGVPGSFGPGAELCIYRLVQEALTNVGKHARASRADIRVVQEDGGVLVRVTDDGAGFDAEQPTAGFGLEGMRERAALMNGDLRVETSEQGTVIEAHLPLS